MSKKVSLVLSSGGARGLAHIGVIEELLEQGYEIEAISGSSIGAAIGGLYAAGKLEIFKKWIIDMGKIDVFKLFDFTFGNSGFIKGEKVFEEMERVLGDSKIEDFNIPFTAVATDIQSNEDIWIQKGSLFKAIRASVAVPSILTPIYQGNRIIVDGGVGSPVPIDPVKDINHDLLIVVNTYANIPFIPKYRLTKQEKKVENEYIKRITTFKNKWTDYFSGSEKSEPIHKKKKAEKLGYMTLLNRSIEYMANKLIAYKINEHQPDMVIEISKHICGLFEFYKAKELIEEGRIAGKAALENYEQTKANKIA